MRFVVFICFLVAASAHAQRFPFEFWHEGKIVLEEGDTLRGNIKYDLQSDLLQYEKDNKLGSYTARKVVYFDIFDKTAKRYRYFYSLPYAALGAYKAPVFFELLAEGKLTLLCRESVELRSYPSSFYYYGSTNRMVLVYKYFFLNPQGMIEPFTGKRNDLIAMMGNEGPAVEKYMKTNRLSLDSKYEFSQIIEYYNSQVK
ncbi:MAG TPA: hypothetical protein VG737_16630 [Cyclobacteriaceae bacterium]|nr:hypothetical protein [Cyclobacteriaceae bacterium]